MSVEHRGKPSTEGYLRRLCRFYLEIRNMKRLGIMIALASLLGIGVATAHALTCNTTCWGNRCTTYCY